MIQHVARPGTECGGMGCAGSVGASAREAAIELDDAAAAPLLSPADVDDDASLSTTAAKYSGAAAPSSSSIASPAERNPDTAQSVHTFSAETQGGVVVKGVEASEPESATIAMAAESAAAAAYFESGYEAAAAYIANAESLSAVKSVGEASSKPSSHVYDEMLAAELGAIGNLSTAYAEPRPALPGAMPLMQDEKTDAPASNERLYQEAAAAYS